MCGIVGLINCGNTEILKRMTNSIAHRGPDDEGQVWFKKNNSGIGHRRLSIIDLSKAGHQPMSNDSKNLWITYNGEIYNYKQIRDDLVSHGYNFYSNSDTEVLLKAYEHWGFDCLQKLNGMFAFVIYDTNSQTLFAARDRIGIKPFYYFQQNDCFIFASEIKAILATEIMSKEPDYYSLLTPTRFQISPHTGFKNIQKLIPGNYLIFKNGSSEVKPFWSISPTEKRYSGEDEVLSNLDNLLNEAVDFQMIADVPVGVLLSGGLDSSLIAALMRKRTTEEIHSFTIRFSEKDQKFEKTVEDYTYARKVAAKFNLTYHEIVVEPDVEDLLPKLIWHLDEPLADAAAINTYLISKAARELGIVVLLSGMGGDEIFGGYRKHLACLKADVYQTIFPGIIRELIEFFVNRTPVATSKQGLRIFRWIKRFISFASLQQDKRFWSSDMSLTEKQFNDAFLQNTKYEDTHFFKAQANNFKENNVSYLTQMCLNDTKVFLPEHNLNYSDKASMMASVEMRPPLTDHQIVDYLFTLDPEYKIKKNTQKYILKKVGEKYLDKEIIYRRKEGFASPLRSWVRGPLSELVSDFLSEEVLKKRGLYNPTYASRLIERDRRGLEDNSYLIWQLLNTELWFRTFFEN